MYLVYIYLFIYLGVTASCTFILVHLPLFIVQENCNNAHRYVQERSQNFKSSTFSVVNRGKNMEKKRWLSLCLMVCVRFARYCGKMYSCHLLFYVGFFLFNWFSIRLCNYLFFIYLSNYIVWVYSLDQFFGFHILHHMYSYQYICTLALLLSNIHSVLGHLFLKIPLSRVVWAWPNQTFLPVLGTNNYYD